MATLCRTTKDTPNDGDQNDVTIVLVGRFRLTKCLCGPNVQLTPSRSEPVRSEVRSRFTESKIQGPTFPS